MDPGKPLRAGPANLCLSYPFTDSLGESGRIKACAKGLSEIIQHLSPLTPSDCRGSEESRAGGGPERLNLDSRRPCPLSSNLKYNLLLAARCESEDKGGAPGMEVMVLRFTIGEVEELKKGSFFSSFSSRNPIFFYFGLQIPQSQFLHRLL